MATEAPLPAGFEQEYESSIVQNINDGAFDLARTCGESIFQDLC